MLITEFIKQLDELSISSAIKEKFISERIKRKYIPVTEKKEKLNAILQKSIVEDARCEYIDLISNEIYFINMIFLSYTDLIMEPNDNSFSSLIMYDIIKSSGIDEEILPRIGKDLLEYRFMNEQLMSMWEKRNEVYNEEKKSN